MLSGGTTVACPVVEDVTAPAHNIVHLQCLTCSPGTSFCGRKRDAGPQPARTPDCVVCLDLWHSLHACPRCGGDLDTCWGRKR